MTPANGSSSALSPSSLSLSLVLSLPPLDKLVLTYFIPTLLRPSSRFPQRNDEPLSRIPGLQKKRNFCGRVVLILQHRSAEVPSSAAEEQLRGEEKKRSESDRCDETLYSVLQLFFVCVASTERNTLYTGFYSFILLCSSGQCVCKYSDNTTRIPSIRF